MWGLVPVLVDETELRDAIALARRQALGQALARPGDFVLLVQGFAADRWANTPSITVLRVTEPDS